MFHSQKAQWGELPPVPAAFEQAETCLLGESLLVLPERAEEVRTPEAGAEVVQRAGEPSECEDEEPGRGQVKFRSALIEVDNPADFWAGVVGGQVAAIEEAGALSGTHIFRLYEDAIHDLCFSETWLAGYLLGFGDALLRGRKSYPHTYSALLKPLKQRSGRTGKD